MNEQLKAEILFEMQKSIYFLYRIVEDLYSSGDGRIVNARESISKTAEMLERLTANSHVDYREIEEDEQFREGDEVQLSSGEWRAMEHESFSRKPWPGRKYRRPIFTPPTPKSNQ